MCALSGVGDSCRSWLQTVGSEHVQFSSGEPMSHAYLFVGTSSERLFDAMTRRCWRSWRI